MCYSGGMKAYIHARLRRADRAVLDDLKRTTGESESELVRRGLHLVSRELGRKQSALEVAGPSAGRFKKGPTRLSTDKKHLQGFGE